MSTSREKMEEFARELGGFAQVASDTLGKIEADMEGQKGLFEVFARMMLTIRGSAEQLGLHEVSKIASLGEEIAVKGTTAQTRPQIRKCVGTLWDVVTSVKYLIENHGQVSGEEEQQILINRLEYTLNAFGGGRPKVDQDEIEKLLRERS